MDFLGVGPLELFFIFIIALIVLGPKDMVKTGKMIGSLLRKIVKSPTWNAVQQTSRDLRYLPNKLMREAGLEEDAEELKKIGKEVEALGKVNTSISDDLKKTSSDFNKSFSAWTTPPGSAEPTTGNAPPATSAAPIPEASIPTPPSVAPADPKPMTSDSNAEDQV